MFSRGFDCPRAAGRKYANLHIRSGCLIFDDDDVLLLFFFFFCVCRSSFKKCFGPVEGVLVASCRTTPVSFAKNVVREITF